MENTLNTKSPIKKLYNSTNLSIHGSVSGKDSTISPFKSTVKSI
jgi:hypothetical protein